MLLSKTSKTRVCSLLQTLKYDFQFFSIPGFSLMVIVPCMNVLKSNVNFLLQISW